MAGAERVALEAVEHLFLDLRWDAAALVADLQNDLAVGLPGADPDGLARRRKADRVRQQVEQDLAHALAVGHEASEVLRGVDLEGERGLGQTILDAPCRRLDGLANIDHFRRQLQSARIDGGKIKNIVENRKKRA